MNERFPNALTVAQLIAKLQQLPPEHLVVADGCDDYEACVDAFEMTGFQDGTEPFVLLARHPEATWPRG